MKVNIIRSLTIIIAILIIVSSLLFFIKGINIPGLLHVLLFLLWICVVYILRSIYKVGKVDKHSLVFTIIMLGLAVLANALVGAYRSFLIN